MEIELPERKTGKKIHWADVDIWLDSVIATLPDYMSKRQFRTELAKALGYPVGYGSNSEENAIVKRLALHANRAGKVKTDPNRWRMLFINKPQEIAVIH